MADLRVVDGCFDLELLDRLGGWLYGHASARSHVARAIDRELAVDRAADGEPAQVVVVHRALQRIRTLEGRAADEPREPVRRAVTQRNLLNELAVDHLTHRGLAGFEQRAFCRHLDFLGDPARFQREVDLGAIADAHFHLFPQLLPEPLQFGADGVDRRVQVDNRVLATLVGDGRAGGVGLNVDDRDGDARKDGARCVDDAAGDRSACFLRLRAWRSRNQQNDSEDEALQHPLGLAVLASQPIHRLPPP